MYKDKKPFFIVIILLLLYKTHACQWEKWAWEGVRGAWEFGIQQPKPRVLRSPSFLPHPMGTWGLFVHDVLTQILYPRHILDTECERVPHAWIDPKCPCPIPYLTGRCAGGNNKIVQFFLIIKIIRDFTNTYTSHLL